jgi:hypothetical protein
MQYYIYKNMNSKILQHRRHRRRAHLYCIEMHIHVLKIDCPYMIYIHIR